MEKFIKQITMVNQAEEIVENSVNNTAAATFTRYHQDQWLHEIVLPKYLLDY